MAKSEIRAGDRAFVKVGRNLVEVRVEARTEDGWRVASRTGKTLTAKTLLAANGEPLAAHTATAPAPAASAPKVPPAASAAPSPKSAPSKGLSLICAAAAVLERSDAPMAVKAMVEAAKAEGLWTPGGGKTPEQTLYSAIIREIRDRGDAARFRKAGRGLFAFAR